MLNPARIRELTHHTLRCLLYGPLSAGGCVTRYVSIPAGLYPFWRRGVESRRSNPSGWWRLVRARSVLAAIFMLGATNFVEAPGTPAHLLQRALGAAEKG